MATCVMLSEVGVDADTEIDSIDTSLSQFQDLSDVMDNLLQRLRQT